MPRFTVCTVACFLMFELACARTSHSPFAGTDSNSYQLCENQAQCPAGSYCQAGVCDADCNVDADCPAGQSCGSRGQCGSSAAPSPFAGQLSVSVPSLALAVGQQSASLRVENTGTAAIDHFHAISDNPAVAVTPARGALPAGQGFTANINIKPGWSGQATVRVLSSGGTSITSLTAQSGLVGYLRGTVDVTGPFLLGTADLALDLNGGLSGVVDGAASLLWPFNARVTATDDGTNATLSFTLVGDPGSDGNLTFGAQVQREVTLVRYPPGAVGPLTRYLSGGPGRTRLAPGHGDGNLSALAERPEPWPRRSGELDLLRAHGAEAHRRQPMPRHRLPHRPGCPRRLVLRAGVSVRAVGVRVVDRERPMRARSVAGAGALPSPRRRAARGRGLCAERGPARQLGGLSRRGERGAAAGQRRDRPHARTGQRGVPGRSGRCGQFPVGAGALAAGPARERRRRWAPRHRESVDRAGTDA